MACLALEHPYNGLPPLYLNHEIQQENFRPDHGLGLARVGSFVKLFYLTHETQQERVLH